jgi:uncharacterized membrane protein
MTDALVVGLLLVIILLLVSISCPEAPMYIMIAVLSVIAVASLVLLIIAFMNDPLGFVRSLVVDNPPMTMSKEMMNSTMVVADGVKLP